MFKNWRIGWIVISIFLFVYCNSKDRSINAESQADIKPNYQEIKKSRIRFNFNQAFEVKEIKKGASISDIHLSGVGFQNGSHTLKIENIDPIEAYLIGDIDFDGFEEFYILTRSVGSGSYGKIIGITSAEGKSYKQIYFPEYDRKLDLNFEYLVGYMGHDSIYVKDKKLYRKFPVYNQNDQNSNATGGERILEYILIEYNGSYTMQVNTFKNKN